MASTLRVGGLLLMRTSSQAAWTAPPLLRPANWVRQVSTTLTSSSTTPTASQVTPDEDYWVKNKRLNRPLSPHLSIYKPQLTSMLSITHRGTGVVLSLAISAFSIGMLAAPATFPYYLGVLSQAHYGPAAIFTAKMLLIFPFTFHCCNGVRHLIWDLGYGFSLATLYKTGYGVLALAVLSSVALAAY